MLKITHKVCSKCKKEQTIDQFFPDERYKDGYMGLCKACRRLNTKRYKEKHPEYKERIKELNRKRKSENNLLNNVDNIIGGWNIYIPNYIKKEEYKFNALSTRGEIFKTNNFTAFKEWLTQLYGKNT